MGMSTHVIGFRSPDERWFEMKAVWDACEEAKVDRPKEVEEFFDFGVPDDNGVEVSIPVQEWNDEFRRGFEIKVENIPKDTTMIRFFNAW